MESENEKALTITSCTYKLYNIPLSLKSSETITTNCLNAKSVTRLNDKISAQS
jgi:hypothetical protein